MKREIVIMIDCGDTIVDESTQVFAENEDVLSAQPIPGADVALRTLHEQGYRMVLVADGRTTSFHNILGGLGLLDLFEALVISQEEEVAKPHPKMFETALARMGLTQADAHRCVMIGNNLRRDIVGANRMGITSILLSYTPRYLMIPEDPEQIPDYVIAMPCELPGIIAMLEQQCSNRRVLGVS